jgi:SAM-dependent MidA family methyltransferase
MRDDLPTPDTALPEPTAAEVEHSLRLVNRIRDDMSGKPISFARFMELALYAPGLGYYSAGKTKFGGAGDFITAPELGDVFAKCVAHQCAQVLAELDGGDVLEAGGGSGALAADLLTELEQLHQLPDNYFVLELSADLRQRQQQHIDKVVPHLRDRVHWLDQLPDAFTGVVLANELLDAMPVSLFHTTSDGVMERYVALDDSGFHWLEQAAPLPLEQRVNALHLDADYISEINFNAESWIHSLSQSLKQGLILLIDYGFPASEYYHPQRKTGTLMCHYRHRSHTDPLAYVGLQDITAHVDFTAIAQAAVDSGLDVLGYTSQAAFLMSCGLDQLVAKNDPDNTRAHLEMTAQIKKLTLPSEMGELFKVLALGREIESTLVGYSIQDRRDRL